MEAKQRELLVPREQSYVAAVSSNSTAAISPEGRNIGNQQAAAASSSSEEKENKRTYRYRKALWMQ
jgi:hypothetical protein